MSIRSTLLLLVVSLSAGAQELPFTHFTTGGQGAPLPSASVQKIVQDDQGYIWLAFYSTGIARYDGHRMETYGIADGIADPTVREIAEDATHHLWIGSEAGLVVSAKPLNAYAPGERVRFVANVGDVTLARSRMRRNCVVASRDGSVWVGTQNGIERYRFEGSRLSTEKIDTPAGVQAMLVRRDGSVLASLLDNQIIVAGKGPLTKLASGAGALLEAPDGTIWGGSNDGSVWRLENGVAHVINHDLAERIVALLITHDGDLWAASLGTGALRIDPRNPQNHLVITRANGLLGETLWTLFEDREGNLWLGQNGGASSVTSSGSESSSPPVLATMQKAIARSSLTRRARRRRCPILRRSRSCLRGAARCGWGRERDWLRSRTIAPRPSPSPTVSTRIRFTRSRSTAMRACGSALRRDSLVCRCPVTSRARSRRRSARTSACAARRTCSPRSA